MTEKKTPGRTREAITVDRRDQIVGLINRWTKDLGKLTGPNLEKQVEKCLNLVLTRQGMFKHQEIDTAFVEKRKELEGGKPKRIRLVGEELLLQRIKRLEDENARLKAIKSGYEERFVRYLYNAKMKKGMTVEELDTPLPSRIEG
jgi:hypothetical protein